MKKGKSNNIFNDEPKSGEVKKLKAQIRKQEHEIARLKSELRTYDKAFQKNIVFLKEKTVDLTVEELIKGAEEELTLRQIKDEKINNFADLKKKWACFECNEGVMKLIIIPNGTGSNYFRLCSNPKCKHRTDVKTYTEEVEGVR